MPSPKANVHDGFVTADDFVQVKHAIACYELQKLMCELIVREPQIGVGVSEQVDHMLALLEGATMSIQQRVVIRKHLIELVWLPLIALARAHRRAWDDFLPLIDATDGQADTGKDIQQ